MLSSKKGFSRFGLYVHDYVALSDFASFPRLHANSTVAPRLVEGNCFWLNGT
jgi:hypothetical protein